MFEARIAELNRFNEQNPDVYKRQDIESGLCYLENFAPDIELQAFEEKVCCLVQNQMLVNIIDRALLCKCQ